jgi:hypothetical protein
MLNVAFYNHRKRQIIAHEVLDVPRNTAGMAALQLSFLRSQEPRNPKILRYWLAWEKPEDLGVFDLDSINNFLNPETLDFLDDVYDLVRKISPN